MDAFEIKENITSLVGERYAEYWQSYHLQQDPFPLNPSEFYPMPLWDESIELLQHLVLHTNVIAAITGGINSGKTSFIREFQRKLIDSVNTYYFNADPRLDAEELLEILTDAFSLSNPAPGDLESRYQEQLDKIIQSERRSVIVIDDAHQLPKKIVEILFNLIRQQPETQSQLHVVLIGEIDLISKVKESQTRAVLDKFMYRVDLRPFNLQETQEYLRHCFNQAGAKSFPLTTSNIARIQKLSEGYIGRINRVSKQLLVDALYHQKAQSETEDNKQDYRIKLIGASVIIVGLLSAAFILGQQNNSREIRSVGVQQAEPFDPQASMNTAVTKVSKTNLVEKSQNSPTAMKVINSSSSVSFSKVSLAALPEKIHSVTKDPIQQSMIDMPAKLTLKPLVMLPKAILQDTKATEKAKVIASNSAVINSVQPKIQAKVVASKSEIVQKKVVTSKSEVVQEEVAKVNDQTPVETTSDINLVDVSSDPSIRALLKSEVGEDEVSQESGDVLARKSVVIDHVIAVPVLNKNLVNKNKPQTAKAKTVVALHSNKAIKVSSQQATVSAQQLAKTVSANYFTLQLVANGDERVMKAFIQKYHLSQKAHYYHTKYHGKNWYTLVYGKFASIKEAKGSIAKLPLELQQLKPWPRSYASIQKQG